MRSRHSGRKRAFSKEKPALEALVQLKELSGRQLE
jgi:hypothetical protein